MAPTLAGTVGEILGRLSVITDELIAAYGEQVESEQHDLEARVRGWFNDGSNSVTARDRGASFAALEPSLHLIDVKGRIRQLIEERDNLRLRLTYINILECSDAEG